MEANANKPKRIGASNKYRNVVERSSPIPGTSVVSIPTKVCTRHDVPVIRHDFINYQGGPDGREIVNSGTVHYAHASTNVEPDNPARKNLLLGILSYLHCKQTGETSEPIFTPATKEEQIAYSKNGSWKIPLVHLTLY